MKKQVLFLSIGLASLAQLSKGQAVVNYSFTGSPQTFTVPSCVNTITITARGASGGAGASGGPALSIGGNGGFGAIASGIFTITPGAVLSLFVGGAGGSGNGIGGFNGGANSGTVNGGGGGGATDVRLGGLTLTNRIIVAGGGGGGGRGGCESTTVAVIGGNGGNGASNGFAGINAPTSGGFAGAGQGGVTGGSGGAAGIGCSGFLGTPGGSGVLGLGGMGGSGQNCCCFTFTSIPTGGGGGGGYFGGGGGGGGSAGTVGCSGNDKGAGGGGAGGTNFFDPSFTNTVVATHTATGDGFVTISYTTFPVVSVSAVANTVCANSNAVLSASGAATYSWSSGGSGASTTVTPSSNTIYTVTGTTSGCIASKTIAISTIPTPTLVITPSLPNGCLGSTVALSVSGASTYTWNTNATTAGITATVTAGSNTFNVQGTGSNGCKSTSSVSIGTLPNPTVTIVSSNPTICAGSSSTLTANGAASYLWSNAGTTTSIVVTPTVTTTYTVSGLSGLGCSSSTTIVQNVSLCAGLNEFEKGIYSIYPNPVVNTITIKSLKEMKTITISDVLGSVVMSKTANANVELIDVKELKSGIYFLSIDGAVQRFIKQ